jgi:hypothetical protein
MPSASAAFYFQKNCVINGVHQRLFGSANAQRETVAPRQQRQLGKLAQDAAWLCKLLNLQP